MRFVLVPLLFCACIDVDQDDDPPPSRSIVVEREPNDGAGGATELEPGATAQGRIGAHDEDWWRIELEAGETLAVQVFAARFDQAGWRADPPVVRVLGPDGTELARHDPASFGWGVVDPDVPAVRAERGGAHHVVLAAEDARRAGGAYLLVVQKVAVAPALEREPDDSAATAGELAPGALHGFHRDGEEDWFRVLVTEPALLTFAVVAQRNGVAGGDDDVFDAELALLDGEERVLARGDDGAFDDSLLEWLCTAPGDYFLRLGEARGAGDAPYFLIHEARPLADALDEAEPNDTPSGAQVVRFDTLVRGELGALDRDVFAVPCMAGDRLELWLHDLSHHQDATAAVEAVLDDRSGEPLAMDVGPELGVRSVRLTEDGLHFLYLGSSAPTPYAFELRLETARWESEPDDGPDSASAFDLAGHAAGRMDRPQDVDAFSFEAEAGVPVLLECFADDEYGSRGFDQLDGDASDLDPVLEVLDPRGRTCAGASALERTAVGVVRGRATVAVAFVPAASGTHVLLVRDAHGACGPSYTYSVTRN